MALRCGLLILVIMVTMTSSAPVEEIKRLLEDLLLLEDLKEAYTEKHVSKVVSFQSEGTSTTFKDCLQIFLY